VLTQRGIVVYFDEGSSLNDRGTTTATSQKEFSIEKDETNMDLRFPETSLRFPSKTGRFWRIRTDCATSSRMNSVGDSTTSSIEETNETKRNTLSISNCQVRCPSGGNITEKTKDRIWSLLQHRLKFLET
jgi:hypothetical protein